MTAITWGWTSDKPPTRLMEESTKAHKNGEAYAELTARNAARLWSAAASSRNGSTVSDSLVRDMTTHGHVAMPDV